MQILRTRIFDNWLTELRDHKAQATIGRRIVRLEGGNPGDFRSVGEGVLEMRIDFGPGYRVYYVKHERCWSFFFAAAIKDLKRKTLNAQKP